MSIFLAEGACVVQEMTAEIEAMLLPLGARAHWGKIGHTRAAQLAPLYPKLQAF